MDITVKRVTKHLKNIGSNLIDTKFLKQLTREAHRDRNPDCQPSVNYLQNLLYLLVI